MSEKTTRTEMHGCIVCGKLHQLLVVYDANGKLFDLKVMSADGKRVVHESRPLVACEHHNDEQVKTAVERVYGTEPEEE
ncbi:MAG: hypothetical protein IPP55_16280 [Anaerolineales bacterium]|jgi:hypothetical protein|nr:hypothetical protein [Anaerolineales bacterium]